MEQDFKPINYSKECGVSRGCFLYPLSCSGDDCEYVTSYHANVSAGYVDFEIMGSNSGYVALAFSDDVIMVRWTSKYPWGLDHIQYAIEQKSILLGEVNMSWLKLISMITQPNHILVYQYHSIHTRLCSCVKYPCVCSCPFCRLTIIALHASHKAQKLSSEMVITEDTPTLTIE